MSWQNDKKAADVYMPEIQEILAKQLKLEFIRKATEKEDQEENTDLVGDGRIGIAVRMRAAKYLPRYGSEFTIRSSRPGGTPTELDKILSGRGTYMFYGFGDNNTGKILIWHILSLDVFRDTLMDIKGQPLPDWFTDLFGPDEDEEKPCNTFSNKDGSSCLRAFVISKFSPDLVVACSKVNAPQPASVS